MTLFSIRRVSIRSVRTGRIVRFVDPDTVIWITGDCDIHLTKITELEVAEGYTGRWEHFHSNTRDYYHRLPNGDPDFKRLKFQRPIHWVTMPTLCQLKQRASRVHGRHAWKTSPSYEKLVLEAY